MRAKDRLSPYPILRASSDDYKTGFFSAKIVTTLDDYGKLNINVDFNLDSPYLKSLIDGKMAAFVTHIECPLTSYRHRISGNTISQFESIPVTDLADTVEVNTFITAIENIEDYSSDEFNEEYDGFNFSISKNEILAIGDSAKITVTNDTRNLESFPSIIKIVKVDDAQKAMSVDTDGDMIKIRLAGDVHEKYKSVGNSIYTKTSFALIIFPALLIVLTRFVNGTGTDLEDRRWYQVLSKALGSKKININDLSIDDGSMLEACQKLFEDPITKAFDELVNYAGRYDED